MFEPIKARVASSSSKKGINAAEDLGGRDIDKLDLIRIDVLELPIHAGDDSIFRHLSVLIRAEIGRSHDLVDLFVSPKINDILRDLAVLHSAVRRDQEAVIVDSCINRERADETNVRAFGRFDRTDAAIMRNMDVSHFEPRSLPVQSSRSQGRESPLVRQLRKWIRLIYDL
jgi:hypothetical protein